MSVENTHFGKDKIEEMLKSCRSIFFIGVGGINMSSLALLSARMGYRTGGSDRTRTALTEKLAGSGIDVFYGHSAENARNYDAFVYTVAISEDNPEYVYARERGLPCISRADFLGYIMTKYERRIGISGMHGKSSCTSMCAEILIDCGADPTVLSGAELARMDGAYCLGEGREFVFEACEYMDSFLDFNPNIAVILNIEMDHVDYFHSMDQIKTSFANYASLVGKDGYIVYNSDDENVVSTLSDVAGRKVSFSLFDEDADFVAVNIRENMGRYEFDAYAFGKLLCHIRLRVSGRYNVYNALAAAAVCYLCGIDGGAIAKGLYGFCGARRRMEYKGSVSGADIYDDYGHHPTEIAATLGGARRMTRGKLVCVYQPHTYSRTAALFDEFAASFDACDEVIFVDIYAAREQNVYGVSSALLAERIGARARFSVSFEAAAKMLSDTLTRGDVGIVMGAGDVYKTFEYIPFEKE